ncbi:hypothetical protein SAMN05216556_102104 [Aequorivita viscosa]|uniref:Uncharacterized protein n=1 Tax=Aequorivita viscosa TaxID=797419 RepID=A0A1M6A7T9_9FLAO|nr:hypothetical protein SAMN05216556_102104 [Aequorivita viscosa]SHI32530.1 hypothetical protein SAMN04487908_101103 [Aequorivita viscosa]
MKRTFHLDFGDTHDRFKAFLNLKIRFTEIELMFYIIQKN